MLRRTVAVVAGAALVALTGCGDDDDASADDEYCELVRELNASEEQPSDDLLDRYVAAAPDEIADEAEVAAEAIQEEGEAAFDDPDVLDAIEDIEDFEAEECGVERVDDDDEGDDGEEAPEDTDATTGDTSTEDDGATTSTSTEDSMTTVSTP
jgi:hypothetical protein